MDGTRFPLFCLSGSAWPLPTASICVQASGLWGSSDVRGIGFKFGVLSRPDLTPAHAGRPHTLASSGGTNILTPFRGALGQGQGRGVEGRSPLSQLLAMCCVAGGSVMEPEAQASGSTGSVCPSGMLSFSLPRGSAVCARKCRHPLGPAQWQMSCDLQPESWFTACGHC